MSEREPGCFICSTHPDLPPDTPWHWTGPGALCPSHQVTLILEDGQLLESVLIRLKPAENPLEGSLLAWIFNPVFLDGEVGRKIRCWTDFAGGGMAVLEDRFYARNYFEFRSFENARAVDLLYSLHLATAAGATVATMKDLLACLHRAEKRKLDAAHAHITDVFEGLRGLIRAWNFQWRLTQLRNKRGHIWPETFSSLCDWVSECDHCGDELQEENEVLFFQELNQLASRRFPGDGLCVG